MEACDSRIRWLLVKLALLAGLLGCCMAMIASPITATWTASTDPNVKGYFLYAGSTSIAANPYTAPYKARCLNTNGTLILPPGTWYLVVTAFATSEDPAHPFQSVASNEVIIYIPGAVGSLEVPVSSVYTPPDIILSSNATIRITTWLQTSTDLISWSEGIPAVNFYIDNSQLRGFYRTRMSIQGLP